MPTISNWPVEEEDDELPVPVPLAPLPEAPDAPLATDEPDEPDEPVPVTFWPTSRLTLVTSPATGATRVASPIAASAAVCAAALFWGLYRHRDALPFIAANGLFVLSYIGLGISFYPYILPPKLSIWDAAAPDESLKFLIVGALVLVPLILAYTALSYWVFRGKVDPDAGYH